MADGALTRAAARMPAALRIAVVYIAARLVTAGFFAIAAHLSTASSRFGVDPSPLSFVLGWDAQWYWFTAVHGYPSELPLTDAGVVAENQWAFMPIYAFLSAGVGALLGSWGAGAFAVSLVAGYLACVVLYRMLRDRVDASAATWAVVFFAAGPLAALFQVGYAEPLFLLWLLLALWCVQRRAYVWLYALIPLMGYTRPGVLAFALFLGLFGIWRWFRRRAETLRTAEVLHIVALGALATVVGFSWQVIAGIVTGDPGAYLATELAWRRNFLSDPSGAFVPFEGFVQAAAFWGGQWGIGAGGGYVLLVVLVLAIAAVLLFEPHVRRLGVEPRLWAASYLVYLLAVFFPQSSVFRLLVPLSPLWGALALPRSTAWRVGVLALALVGQWWWIHEMYAMGNTFTRIP